MDIKIIASDLDGTLLNNNSQLSDYTRAVLRSYAEKGTKIVFATGRAFDTVPKSVTDFAFAHYIICSNGAGVYDLKHKKLLKSCVINKDSARKLTDYALKNKLGLELIVGGKAHGEKYYFEHPEEFGFDKRSRDYLFSTRKRIKDFNAFLSENIKKIESIDFVLKNPEMKEEIKAVFGDDKNLYITSSHFRIVEFSSPESGKEKALKYILSVENLSKNEMIAFGNAENDIGMIELASLGVASADSPEKVKEKADAVCGGCNDDGVAEFLESLFSFDVKETNKKVD